MSEYMPYPGSSAEAVVQGSINFVQGLQTNIAAGKDVFDAKAKALTSTTQQIQADLHSAAMVMGEANLPIDTIHHSYIGAYEEQGWLLRTRAQTAPGFSLACPLWWILDVRDKDLSNRRLEKADKNNGYGKRVGVSIEYPSRILPPGTTYTGSALAITPSGNAVSVHMAHRLGVGECIGPFRTAHLRPFKIEDFIDVEKSSADSIQNAVDTMRSRVSAATDRYIERMKQDREGRAERRQHPWFLIHDEPAWVNQEVPEEVLVNQGLEAWCQNR